MPKDLFELAEGVRDETSFLEFILELAKDRLDEYQNEELNPSSPYGPDANGWENGTIEAFLGAAYSWGKSSKSGLPLAGYQPPSNPWTRAAQILYMGKIYE